MFDGLFKWINAKVPPDALTALLSGKVNLKKSVETVSKTVTADNLKKVTTAKKPVDELKAIASTWLQTLGK